MKRTLALFVLLSSAACAAPQATGSEAAEQAKAAEAAVMSLRDQAVAQVRLIAATGRFQLMGLKNAAEAERARAGAPVAIFWLDLKGIGKALEDVSRPSVLLGVGRVMVPVLVDGEFRSGILFERVNNAWKPLIFGEKTLSPAIYEAANVTKANAPREEGTAHVVVSIPSLGVVATATLAGRSFGISKWNRSSDALRRFSMMKREDFAQLKDALKKRANSPHSLQILREIKEMADRREELK